MKNKIITVLIIVIIVLLIIGSLVITMLGYQKYDKSYKVHNDSVIVAKSEIENLKIKESKLISQHVSDSIKIAKQKLMFHATINAYEKKLAAINFVDIKTSDELDSIRNIIYPHGDSAYIILGPDPLYAMPFSQARDAMEAKAREPFYDSINNIQAVRIYTLEAQVDKQNSDCNERVAVAEKKYTYEQIVTRNQAAIIADLEKKEKRKKFFRVLKDIGIGVVAFFAGKA